MSVTELKISNDEAYGPLDPSDLPPHSKQMSLGAGKVWVSEFAGQHLPQNRLKTHDDDLSLKFQAVDCSRSRKKKRRKSRGHASVEYVIKNKRRWMVKPTDCVRYTTYLPLKEMWTKYAEDIINFSSLGDTNINIAANKLLKADLHGCPLTVRKSKCPSYIGVSGIVIQETRNVLVLVTQEDKVKYIPKAKNVFSLVLHDFVFTIHGNQFLVKPGERSAKKFKTKPSIDL